MFANSLCAQVAARSSSTLPRSPAAVFSLRVLKSAAWPSKRVFVTTPRHRKDDLRVRMLQVEQKNGAKQSAEESAKPGYLKQVQAVKSEPVKAGALLSEQTVSNKDQRKADWRILKDMSHYLWPKDDLGTRFRVGLSVALLIGAKVGNGTSRITL